MYMIPDSGEVISLQEANFWTYMQQKGPEGKNVPRKKVKKLSVGAERRCEFREFWILWHGRINRADMKMKSEVSARQASLDLTGYATVLSAACSVARATTLYLHATIHAPGSLQVVHQSISGPKHGLRCMGKHPEVSHPERRLIARNCSMEEGRGAIPGMRRPAVLRAKAAGTRCGPEARRPQDKQSISLNTVYREHQDLQTPADALRSRVDARGY